MRGQLARARELQGGFKAAVIATHLAALSSETDDTAKVAAGLLDGGSWRAGLADGCSLEEAVEKARLTLFKQKGLRKCLDQHISSLMSLQDKGTELAKYGLDAAEDEEHKRATRTVARARATIAEAMLLQALRTATDGAAPRDECDKATSWMAENEVDTDLILPCVWTKAQETVADAPAA